MARRAGDPKVRYIAFRVRAPTSLPRQAMIQAIQHAGRALDAERFEAAGVWLTRFDGADGIVRCHHHGAALAREALVRVAAVRTEGAEVPVQVEPVGTSGTIRSLVERHVPNLRDDGRRK